MATIKGVKRNLIGKASPSLYSKIRTTIETAFYGNNVIKVDSLHQAYLLAKNSPGTIKTDIPVFEPEKIGLPSDSNLLIFNDGERTGRSAKVRKIIGDPSVDEEDCAGKIREAIFSTRNKKMYHVTVIVGLQEEFMVKAHLLIPEGYENVMYSWMLNFQECNKEFLEKYLVSKPIDKEGDIYVFSNPDWNHGDHPDGLTVFDSSHNCAALLGMRYFGEHKKGTLTLAWSIASRNGYTSCHGGQKRYNLNCGKSYVASFFGLSGSGKSTLTHAKHNDKYDITVLHDDAFIISNENGSSIALEPAYFDKTQDYPTDSPDNKYLLTLQNCGATVDENGLVVPVTEDIRNGNGRAVKSILWSPNRVNKFDEKCNAIFWLMKDESLPPVLKIKSSILGSVMGATLATKRSTAEHLLKTEDASSLVIEPYANPFRTYPLKYDYEKFKSLIDMGIDCYILNTGFFLHKKITPSMTLSIIEQIVEGKAEFESFCHFTQIDYMPIEGYMPNVEDENYIKLLEARMEKRLQSLNDLKGMDRLPYEAIEYFYRIIKKLQALYNKDAQ